MGKTEFEYIQSGNKPYYDVEQFFIYKDDKWIIDKIIVNNPKFFEFYDKYSKTVKVINNG